MKLGILTQPLRVNYGAILQNYALQVVLRELGHNPITIDLESSKCRKNHLWYLRFLKRFILKIQGDKNIRFVNISKQDEFNKVQHLDFIKKNISYIRRPFPLTPNLTALEGFEGYIVGSDQVWRPVAYEAECNYFLDFALGQPVRKIAYAASFGVDWWPFNAATTEIARKCLENYNGVSVREKSGINLCKEYLSTDATHVLDPTMLLSAEKYRELLKDREFIFDGEIVVYILDLTSAKREKIDDICAKIGKRPYYVGVPEKNGNYPSIESWIAGFANAEYVITDSFHGSVFSIIFQKQFITIGNITRGLTRLISLFDMLEIDKSRIMSFENIDFGKLNKIDYVALQNSLNANRNRSIQFLSDAIGN